MDELKVTIKVLEHCPTTCHIIVEYDGVTSTTSYITSHMEKDWKKVVTYLILPDMLRLLSERKV